MQNKTAINITIALAILAGALGAFNSSWASPASLKVAIFTRNTSQDRDNDRYVNMLKNRIVSNLSDKFTIVDSKDVLDIFEEQRKKDLSFKGTGFYDFAAWHWANINEGEPQEKGNDRTSQEKASALRITQALGADYVMICDLEDITVNDVRETVYGQNINSRIITADFSVKILDAVRGGSIAGKTVRARTVLQGDEKTRFKGTDSKQKIPLLMTDGGREVSFYFLDNVEKISEGKRAIPGQNVQFFVRSNQQGAVVEIDGTVLGSTPGTFRASPGIHKLRVTKDGYRSFERNVNIFEGFEVTVPLEMSHEGITKHGRKEAIDADAYSTKKKADAEHKHGPKKETMKDKKDW